MERRRGSEASLDSSPVDSVSVLVVDDSDSWPKDDDSAFSSVLGFNTIRPEKRYSGKFFSSKWSKSSI